MNFAELFANAGAVYMLIGLFIGLAFVISGVGRIDEAAKGSTIFFRLLITPASVAPHGFRNLLRQVNDVVAIL